MPSRHCDNLSGGEDDHVSVQRNCMQTKAMITLDVATRYVAVGSFRVLHGVASTRVSG